MPGEVSNLSMANLAAGGLLTPAAASAVPSAQVLSKAKEFEAILLNQWLQGAETSFGAVPGGDDDQDDGDEQMKSFSVQQLAKAFSDAGGIGIADMVSKALQRKSSSDVSQK